MAPRVIIYHTEIVARQVPVRSRQHITWDHSIGDVSIVRPAATAYSTDITIIYIYHYLHFTTTNFCRTGTRCSPN